MHESKYISIADIAAHIGCNPLTVWRAVQRGILPAAPLPGGRKLWVDRDVADRYIADINTRAASEARERRAAQDAQMTFYDLL